MKLYLTCNIYIIIIFIIIIIIHVHTIIIISGLDTIKKLGGLKLDMILTITIIKYVTCA